MPNGTIAGPGPSGVGEEGHAQIDGRRSRPSQIDAVLERSHHPPSGGKVLFLVSAHHVPAPQGELERRDGVPAAGCGNPRDQRPGEAHAGLPVREQVRLREDVPPAPVRLVLEAYPAGFRFGIHQQQRRCRSHASEERDAAHEVAFERGRRRPRRLVLPRQPLPQRQTRPERQGKIDALRHALLPAHRVQPAPGLSKRTLRLARSRLKRVSSWARVWPARREPMPGSSSSRLPKSRPRTRDTESGYSSKRRVSCVMPKPSRVRFPRLSEAVRLGGFDALSEHRQEGVAVVQRWVEHVRKERLPPMEAQAPRESPHHLPRRGTPASRPRSGPSACCPR